MTINEKGRTETDFHPARKPEPNPPARTAEQFGARAGLDCLIMWLVLSEPFDPTASWLAQGLERHLGGRGRVLHLASSDIGADAQTDRGVDDEGVWFRVISARGAVIDSRKLRGVINRICSSPTALSHRLARRGLSETHALSAPLMRWLHRWPGPVLNRPNVDGLSGDFRPAYWWSDYAVRAGFSVPRKTFDPAAPVESGEAREPIWAAVVGTDVYCLDDPGRVLALSLRSRCRRLAEGADLAIVGVEAMATATGDWMFLGASLRPDLSRGGDAVMRSIVNALGMKPQGFPRGSATRAQL